MKKHQLYNSNSRVIRNKIGLMLRGKIKNVLGIEEKPSNNFAYFLLETSKGKILKVKTAGKAVDYLCSLEPNCLIETRLILNNAEDADNFKFFALYVKKINSVY